MLSCCRCLGATRRPNRNAAARGLFIASGRTPSPLPSRSQQTRLSRSAIFLASFSGVVPYACGTADLEHAAERLCRTGVLVRPRWSRFLPTWSYSGRWNPHPCCARGRAVGRRLCVSPRPRARAAGDDDRENCIVEYFFIIVRRACWRAAAVCAIVGARQHIPAVNVRQYVVNLDDPPASIETVFTACVHRVSIEP